MRWKLLWDFDIQTDHLNSARRPDVMIINKEKENMQNLRICCPGGPYSKIERKLKGGYILCLTRELEKNVEHKSDVCIICNWCS